MNNNYWQNKVLKKNALKSYKKQNIRRLQSMIDSGVDIQDVLGFENLLIECIKDKKIYCFRYFLIAISFSNRFLRDVHIFLKENKYESEEKIFILYTGQKDVKKNSLINKYRSVSKKISFVY